MIKLYEYQHCPYCVRVKFFLKLFDIPFDIEYLDYSDKVTPSQLTGNKSLPIIKLDDSTYMDESLDIIKHVSKKFSIDQIYDFDDINDLLLIVKQFRSSIYGLQCPRFLFEQDLPEFKSESAKEYYKNKFESSLNLTFNEMLLNTEHYKKNLEKFFNKLIESYGESFFLSKIINEKIFILFPTLYNLSVVENIQYPPVIREFLDFWSAQSYLPLYSPKQ